MNTGQITQVAPQIKLTWYHDGKIAFFEIRTVARASWDAWLKTMLELKRDWPKDRPFLSLHDNLYNGAAFTPTIRSYAQQITNSHTSVAQYTAVILPRTIVAQMVKFFVRSNHEPNGEARVFFTVEEGLRWLESHLV